jgi:hypothetical protein
VSTLNFKKVVYYFRAHILALHPKKTKFLIFSKNANLNIAQNSISIDFNNYSGPNNLVYISPIEFINNSENQSIKFLGVLFDPFLNFKAHIASITNKISKSLTPIQHPKP